MLSDHREELWQAHREGPGQAHRQRPGQAHRERPGQAHRELGPVSFLLLAKPAVTGFSPLRLLEDVTGAYGQVLSQLAAAGAEWVQLDEPCLVTDLSADARDAFQTAYATLAGSSGARLLVATYFGGLGENTALAAGLGADGLHVDLVRDPGQLPGLLGRLRPGTVLSAGVVDGRALTEEGYREFCAIIQVDEPALREGLPLRRADRPRYLAWATECFRLATAAVADTTQIHTHMCYAEFADILDAIIALDADVISVEAARSAMDVVGHLAAAGYPAAVGPVVFDVHSPNVPATADLAALIRRSADALGTERVWVNPDCGLKTRRAEEVGPALANMVAATRAIRTELNLARAG